MSNVFEIVNPRGLHFINEVTRDLGIPYNQANVDYITTLVKMASKVGQQHMLDKFEELGATIVDGELVLKPTHRPINA